MVGSWRFGALGKRPCIIYEMILLFRIEYL